MKKTLDFDRFITEKKDEPIEIKVLGKIYKIPPRIPAIVPVMMARAEENLSPNETYRLVLKAADAMFGKAAVDQMCADGITSDEIGLLVQKVFTTINGSSGLDDDVQELSDEDSRKVAGSAKPKK